MKRNRSLVGRLGALVSIGIFTLCVSAPAALAQPGGAAPECTKNPGTSRLVGMIEGLGVLAYVVAGAFALLALVGAAFFFMASGGSQRRADQGKKWAINVVVALLLLGGGFFLRNAVVTWVSSAGDAALGQNSNGGGAGGLLQCDDITSPPAGN